ncbi:MAG: 2-hydroxyacyl-CoA dehydratase [Oscillospiraceae bacterium]|nr:2-hydroxyacyl-CoA dehydratase [Oscillospiraceae bacterium]
MAIELGKDGYPIFTPEMKETHTILIPMMLPIHFQILISVFAQYGYKCEVMTNESREVVDEGLKNVHNDTCYPALLCIGQFMQALKSGKYDVNKVALMLPQTGGGCRASNYIYLLRKALQDTFPQVPVISLNFVGLEKDPRNGWKITMPELIRALYGMMYGDMLMSLYNQCRAAELVKGSSKKVLDRWTRRVITLMRTNSFTNTKKYYRKMLDDFAKIERSSVPRIKVGIVGEIYVKFSPLGNNHLEDFLISEGCEPVVPSLTEFILYYLHNKGTEAKLYDRRSAATPVFAMLYKLFLAKQKETVKIMEEHGVFDPPHDFEHLVESVSQYISLGVNMGEGWLIPAEMGALAESGTLNIICTQPFGCLPNHIIAKGMSRAVKERYPEANIIAIDYDPGATRVNQENRIKLMLANARAAMAEQEKKKKNN